MITRSHVLCLTLVLVSWGCAQEQPGPDAEPRSSASLESGSYNAELNGFDIHYEIHGQGPMLMTVPNSWGLELEGLRALYRPLEGHLSLVYFDPRGMGDSGPARDEADLGMAAVRADFDALRRHLGLESVAAIGWSNGAMNLILLAAEQPETIDAAIFVHGSASFTAEDMQAWAATYPEMMQRWVALQTELADESLTDDDKTVRMKEVWVEEWFPLMLADPDTDTPVLRDLFSDVQFSWAHADYSNREAPVFDARDQLGLITARCLIIAGAHDMTPVAKAEELHFGLATSDLLVFDSSGHFAPVEEPEAFHSAVLEFMGVGPEAE